MPQDDKVLKVGDLVRIKIRYCNYSTIDDIGIVKAVDIGDINVELIKEIE